MPVEWTAHRFAGGALALDVANTLVLRIDPARTFDRFEDARELARFAEAASRYRREELEGRHLAAGETAPQRDRIVALREAIDELFRSGAGEGRATGRTLSSYFKACAEALEPETDFKVNGGIAPKPLTVSLECATAASALSLLPQMKQIRICANCGWLFLDRSRNGSRIWCDMAVCGNRNKARRHYQRSKADGDG